VISVIIPTHNAAGLIGALLDSIAGQTLRPEEVIIVDSSSADGTARIAKDRGATVLSIPQADFDHGRTRTLAAQRAGGKMLVFLTQDAMPADADCLSQLLASFELDPDIAAAYGRQLPAPEASLFARHLRQFNYPEQSGIRRYQDKDRLGLRTAFLSNSFAAYRKTDLAAAGFFRPGLIFGEDMDCAMKLLLAGKKIAYNAEARVVHSHNYSMREDYRRYFDMGVFHHEQQPLIEKFGAPHKQGLQYLKSELAFLAAGRHYHLLVPALLRSCAKYAGYRCGRSCRLFPVWLNRRLSMNQSWWPRKS
jgi:rhamnosyltransferase